MLPRSLMYRSLNIKAPWKQQCLDTVFQSFECKRNDVYTLDNLLDETPVVPVACSFSKVYKDILALAGEEGNLIIMNTNRCGPSAITKDWQAHTNAVFDLDWMPGENNLVTASGDQTLALWDVEVQEKILLFSGHTSSVKSVAFHNSSKDLLISGSRDGHIMLWDKRVNRQQNGSIKPTHDLPGAHDRVTLKGNKLANKSKNSSQYGVTAVVFQNENTFASAGCADGTVKLWDIRKMSGNKDTVVCKSKFTCQSKKGRTYGISNLIFDQAEGFLFASCMDGSIYQYDCINYKSMPVTCYRGHKVGSFFVKLSISPDDGYIMSGSSDCCAYIWPIRKNHHSASTNTETSGPIKLVGHGDEVTSVAWCQSDILKVVTLSDDKSVCVWRSDMRDKEDRFDDDIDVQTYGHAVKNIIKSITSTPRKCYFTSPVKKSPAPQTAIESLTNLPSIHKLSSPSPTITSFFIKSSVKKSSHVNTPKKLILSPRKVDPLEGEVGNRGVKRKLCVEDPSGSGQFRVGKLQRLEGNADVSFDCPKSSLEVQENRERENPLSKMFSSFSLGCPSSVLSERSPNTMSDEVQRCPTALEKDPFEIKSDENAFSKVIYNVKQSSKPSTFSPTANLPDSVKEAHYRTIRGSKINFEPSTFQSSTLETPGTPQSNKINWLTQLSLKKTNEKCLTGVELNSTKQIKTPSRSKVSNGTPGMQKSNQRKRKR